MFHVSRPKARNRNQTHTRTRIMCKPMRRTLEAIRPESRRTETLERKYHTWQVEAREFQRLRRGFSRLPAESPHQHKSRPWLAPSLCRLMLSFSLSRNVWESEIIVLSKNVRTTNETSKQTKLKLWFWRRYFSKSLLEEVPIVLERPELGCDDP